MATWTSATTSSDTHVWTTWVDETSTSAASNDVIWSALASECWCAVTITYENSGYVPAPETEEQRQARVERERQRNIRAEAARLEKEAAREKAEALLRETLDKEQREQFDKTKWFFVISQSGRRYRIRRRWAGNIDEVDQADMIVAEYCIHPQERIPTEDSMLVQKLMLEADESRFLKIANRIPFSTPRPLTPRPLTV